MSSFSTDNTLRIPVTALPRQ